MGASSFSPVKIHALQLKKRQLDKKDSTGESPKNGSVLKNGIVNGYRTVNNGDKGEFDDLISALRTGDVFGEDIAKLKKNRRRITSGQSPPRTLFIKDSTRERDVAKQKLHS